MAEHHGSPGFAGSAPEVLAAVLPARTSRMRVGTGGVLLPRYSPVKVAEVFGVLASLYPDRVDLGLGRAGGPAHDFPERVRALRVLLGMDGAEPEAGEGAQAPPVPPRMWLLGAVGGSAALAGELGADYAFAHFLDAFGTAFVAGRNRVPGPAVGMTAFIKRRELVMRRIHRPGARPDEGFRPMRNRFSSSALHLRPPGPPTAR